MTRQFLGLDIGGSSVKAGLVDLEAGRLGGDLISAPTPQPSTAAAMLPVFAELAEQLEAPHGPVAPGRAAGASRDSLRCAPVGITFPGVIKQGKVCTAANMDRSWIGVHGP